MSQSLWLTPHLQSSTRSLHTSSIRLQFSRRRATTRNHPTSSLQKKSGSSEEHRLVPQWRSAPKPSLKCLEDLQSPASHRDRITAEGSRAEKAIIMLQKKNKEKRREKRENKEHKAHECLLFPCRQNPILTVSPIRKGSSLRQLRTFNIQKISTILLKERKILFSFQKR